MDNTIVQVNSDETCGNAPVAPLHPGSQQTVASPREASVVLALPSLIERASQAGTEAVIIAVTATAGAVGGALLGEMLVGNVAVSHVVTIA
jgi:hypothetical protein